MSVFTTSTSLHEGVTTPATHTEAQSEHPSIQQWLGSSSPPRTPRVSRASDPITGDVLMIIDDSERALACRDGYIFLEDIRGMDLENPIPCQLQWLCTERDGFKGFKNVDNGCFLGHDIWWDFYAKVPHHQGWEGITLSKREGGSYWIQFLHWWTHWQMSARHDGSGVFATLNGGTMWEFARVRDIPADEEAIQSGAP